MPSSVPQTWFILQANAQTSSVVVEGPFLDSANAMTTCNALATKYPGVAYIVVMTVAGFVTDLPQAQPMTLTSQLGNPVLQATPVTP